MKGSIKRSVKGKVRWAAFTAVAGVAGFAGLAQAATRTWDGGGADDNVNTAGNWVNDTLPVLNNGANNVNSDDWIFTGSVRTTPVINVYPVNLLASVTFDASAAAFTLTTSSTSSAQLAQLGTTSNGHITNNSAFTQTISGMFADRGGVISANTAPIVINGVWSLGNLNLSTSGINAVDSRTNNFSGQANITLNSMLTSSGRLLKQGPNTLFITNDANDYYGTTRIEGGAIQISAPNALGTSFGTGTGSSRGTIVGGNSLTGRLELSSGTNAGITFAATEVLTLEARQGAAATAPHLVNVSGNNTWAGQIVTTTGGSEYTISSTGGSLNVSGNITCNLAGNRNLNFDGTAVGEVSGSIQNTGTAVFSVSKNGPGTWTLSGNNSFNGPLTVNAGTLVLSNYNGTTAPVAVNGSATLKLLATGTIPLTPTITLATPNSTLDVSDYATSGGYTLNGTTTLAGGGHVKGPFNVGGGAAVTAGSTVAPTTITFENGLAFTGAGTYNAFFNGTNHSLLDVTGGTLSAIGTNAIKVGGAGLVLGQSPLLHYTGTLAGDGFGAFNLAQLPPRAIASLVNNIAGHSIDLNVTAIDMPKWTGAVDANWDLSTANWKEVTSGNPTTYIETTPPGDSVLFDDTAAGNTTIALNTTVNPALVTANNKNLTYTIGGGGSINGPGSIVKNNTGTFVLANTGGNFYAGGTFVNAGTLQVGDATGAGGSLGTGPVTLASGATLAVNRNDDLQLDNVISGGGALIKRGSGLLTLNGNNQNYNGVITVSQGTLRGIGQTNLGSSNAAIVVLDGATFDTNFAQVGAKTVTVTGAGVNTNGAIVNNGGGQNNTLENVVLAGDTTFGGIGRWDIRNLGNGATLSTTGHAYNLTKVGGNQVNLVNVTVDPALADININGGIFGIETSTTGLGNPNNTLTIGSGTTFQLFNYGTLDKKIVSAGGTIQAASGANNVLAGTVAMSADTTVRVDSGFTLGIPNVVSGNAALLKTQAGTLNLTNPANTYTGLTSITGTLAVTKLANGGQPSSIGVSSADAANLTLNTATVRYLGTTASTTDRAFTINGNTTFDASGVAPDATVAFANAAPVAWTNPTTNAAVITLTGANAGLNVFAPSLSDVVNGTAGPLALNKTGFGTWVLPTANTFTGQVTVSGGVLRARNNSALGVNNLVVVNDVTANANPASVIFDNPTGLTVANNFRTTGGGGGGANPDGPGVIRAAAGNNVLTGNILMTSGGGFSTYTADAGATLEFAGTITNDTARTLDAGGAGTVIISGSLNDGTGVSSLEKRGQGTTIVSGTTNGYTGTTVVNEGTLRVTGSIANSSGVTTQNTGTFEAAAPQVIKKLTVNAGQARVNNPAGGAKFALTVGDGTAASNPVAITGGKVDLTTNGLIVRTAAGNEAATLGSVRDQIVAGFNGGTWQGNGITSRNADSSHYIGYAMASEVAPTGTFLGQTGVDPSSVVARYTLAGDATLDGTVDFNDLVKLAQNYNATVSASTPSWWYNGDFTYDGIVDFNDLVKLAQNYNGSIPADPVAGAPVGFGADMAAAFAAVPEPSCTLAVIAAGGLAGLSRRRRRSTRD
jgi:fibronectin-binding autotransporter adhesin